MAYHSDYNDLLFSKSNIYSILGNAGFPLHDEAENVENQSLEKTPSTPDWMKLYAAKGALRTYEAAWILSGLEPPTAYPRYINFESREQVRYLHVFEDLAGTGEIAFKSSEWHLDDEPGTWMLDHQSILDWCRRTGYEWPLANLMPSKEAESVDLHPKREATYQRIIAALLSMQYTHKQLDEPYKLADEVLDDCQTQAIKAPAGRSTLGDLFKQLPPIQKADLD